VWRVACRGFPAIWVGFVTPGEPPFASAICFIAKMALPLTTLAGPSAPSLAFA
jgi:hypothetical protein